MLDVTVAEQIAALRAVIKGLQESHTEAEAKAFIFASKYQASEARALAAEAQLAQLNGATPAEKVPRAS